MTALSAELSPHPACSCDAIRRIGVTVEPAALPDELAIRYQIDGDIARLRLPEPGFARRRDGLWQHSCFEAFLRADASDSYYEFNGAPSGDWAAYRFAGRRSDRASPGMPAPRISFRRHRDVCELTAGIPIGALPELARARAINAGLAAVIEDQDGRLTWWALAHGGEQPDFHDPSTFLLQLAAP
jgi:hypothetical protein